MNVNKITAVILFVNVYISCREGVRTVGTFLKRGQTYDDFREEERQKTMERHRLRKKLEEEQCQRTAAELEANKKTPETEIRDRIAHLKDWMQKIQPGQVDEPRNTLCVIQSLLDIVEFVCERQFESNQPRDEK